MNILSLYEQYKIMPTLGEHQLRVAAVARMIVDSIEAPLDADGVLRACLVHDMGNIIKFDLSYFPEFLEPHGISYWQKVQDEYVLKYGRDEHIATKEICKEVAMPEQVISYVDAIGFSHIDEIKSDSLEKKICCYADQRVGPHGVLSIHERLADGRARYAGREDKIVAGSRFEELARALETLEEDIFSSASISPDRITDAEIASLVSELRQFEV